MPVLNIEPFLHSFQSLDNDVIDRAVKGLQLRYHIFAGRHGRLPLCRMPLQLDDRHQVHWAAFRPCRASLAFYEEGTGADGVAVQAFAKEVEDKTRAEAERKGIGSDRA